MLNVYGEGTVRPHLYCVDKSDRLRPGPCRKKGTVNMPAHMSRHSESKLAPAQKLLR